MVPGENSAEAIEQKTSLSPKQPFAALKENRHRKLTDDQSLFCSFQFYAKFQHIQYTKSNCPENWILEVR